MRIASPSARPTLLTPRAKPMVRLARAYVVSAWRGLSQIKEKWEARSRLVVQPDEIAHGPVRAEI